MTSSSTRTMVPPLITTLALLLTGVSIALGQSCPLSLPNSDRQDCYPWPGASQEACEQRTGCAWCPVEEPGIPFCVRSPDACPSSIPLNERQDCFSEPGSSRDGCLARGCLWCPNEDGAPWCFFDNTLTQGGEVCPTSEFAVPETERIDCHPEFGSNVETCVQRGCYWCPATVPNAPFCFAPTTQGYKLDGQPIETPQGYRVNLVRRDYPTWYGNDIIQIAIDVEFQEDERLRVKIYDPNSQRFEVPVNIESPFGLAANPLYDIEFSDEPAFNFRVIRRSSGEVLFDTSIGGLQFSNEFLQIAARLPTSNIYGFGETEHRSFRHPSEYRAWGQYSRDEPPEPVNVYGVHPFMTALDSNNEMFGVLFLNSNAQEVQIMPAPGVNYRTTGGILDIYFFLGPSPENVIQQYTAAIGRPVMPAYWGLGFHLSRYGYNFIETQQAAIDRTRNAGIPLDVVYADIDTYITQIIFTYDEDRFPGLPEYVEELKAEGTRYIIILDPFLPSTEGAWYEPYLRGDAVGAYVKTSDGTANAEGVVWPPGNSVWVDYFNPEANQWWIDECDRFKDVLNWDGLWIDMNEPANFVAGSLTGCPVNQLNNPVFKPGAILGGNNDNMIYEKTICSDFLQATGTHSDIHSLYGWSMAIPSQQAVRQLTGTRSLVVSRSTFPSSGTHTGHWLGDNASQWSDLHYSIIGMLEFNMFGIPFIGADICGYFLDATEELCLRWQQLGAFYTFSRNHNGIDWAEQDPGIWPAVGESTREAMLIRYTILPYVYTLFYESRSFGNTVIRSLMHEFVQDSTTHDIDRQFLWGPAFLITPVLDPGVTVVRGYFPDARWYSYYDGSEVADRGNFVALLAPMDFINLHIRGGYILPTQAPANSTMFSRNNPMGLIVALDDNREAQGTLFWDDGESIETIESNDYLLVSYSVSANTLTGSIDLLGYQTDLEYDIVRILGNLEDVSQVLVNGESFSQFTQDPLTREIRITGLSVAVTSDFTISWS